MISLSVSVSENFCIGVNGRLPWYCPPDLKRFKKISSGKDTVLFFGRATWENMPGGLDDRQVFVYTRDKRRKSKNNGLYTSGNNPTEVILSLEKRYGHVLICGGQYIYEATEHLAQRVYLSWIKKHVEGDTYYKPSFCKSKIVSEANWEISEQSSAECGGVEIEFYELWRKHENKEKDSV